MNLPGPNTTDWGTLYNNAIEQLESMINSKTTDITALQNLYDQLQVTLQGLQENFNEPITPATKPLISYDDKGFVTAGADLAVTHIPELPISKIANLQTKLSSLENLIQALSPDLSSVAIKATFQSSRNGLYIKCSTNPLSAVFDWSIEVRNSGGAVVEHVISSSSNVLIDGDSLTDNTTYTIKISIRSPNSNWYSETFQHTYISATIDVEDIVDALVKNNDAMTLFANTLAGSNILAQKVAEARQSSL